jgi:hypothetical protein
MSAATTAPGASRKSRAIALRFVTMVSIPAEQ